MILMDDLPIAFSFEDAVHYSETRYFPIPEINRSVLGQRTIRTYDQSLDQTIAHYQPLRSRRRLNSDSAYLRSQMRNQADELKAARKQIHELKKEQNRHRIEHRFRQKMQEPLQEIQRGLSNASSTLRSNTLVSNEETTSKSTPFPYKELRRVNIH